MLQAIGTGSRCNVARHDNLMSLRQIDLEVSKNLEAMVQAAGSIRDSAAHVVVAGVRMASIRRADLDAWEKFVAPLEIKTKGRSQEYREVAHVIFRHFETQLQGDGSLRRKTISRDQISRYGAAIALAHQWFEEGCREPSQLALRITKTGGVWTLARLWAERNEITEMLSSKESSTDTKDISLRLCVPKPDIPTLLLVLPNGTHRTVPADLAEPVVARMLQ
ncbi:hypothetical protein [Reyranella sp.]|uniref:hypothetical protein n=1 Tax=Reyranella sp. TaxID=1929291 RepID=UPI00121DC789|nr:hypothetical protein [Reyranella sp.]TAJ82104.1 MAG: hypothetical protein EPO50_27815 [Reyranella sp.]